MRLLPIIKKEKEDLEKQVNKLTMSIKNISLISMIFFFSFHIFGQERKDNDYKIYQIEKIKINGLKQFNAETVKAFIGYDKGDVIEVPGEQTAEIINKLWDLSYFSDINLFVIPTSENKVILEIDLKELPKISEVKITGLSKSKRKEFIKDLGLTKNAVLTENLKAKTLETIKNKYVKKGFLKTQVDFKTIADTADYVKVFIDVKKGRRIKIKKINITGNHQIKASKLKKKLKHTKEKRFYRFWKRSKYIADDFKEDLHELEKFYKEKGFRNARVLSDSVYFDKNDKLNIDIHLEEGKKYYFGNIDIVGNNKYSTQTIKNLLSIKKGDVYNGTLINNRIDDPSDPDAESITNLYQNTGYLFSRINLVEKNVRKDTIDFEVRIYEGKPAKFNNITVNGNLKTNDKVIIRELRTIPGDTYSKQNVIRTIRELAQMQIFDAEKITPDLKNIDPNAGTVDVDWHVEESGSSQIQLQGGFDGRYFIGTLGLALKNFSIKNIFNGKEYKPLPMGDGQSLALNFQVSRRYETYSLSFSEPWFGGKKPQAFTVSAYYSTYYGTDYTNYNYGYYDVDRSKKFMITGLTVGLSKKLRWPDDYFYLSQSISLNHYKIKNYGYSSAFGFNDGISNNFSYNFLFGRNSKRVNPIFPTGGSDFSIALKLTPPYSLFSQVDYATIYENPEYQFEDGSVDYEKINKQKYKFIEYYKIKFNGTWFTSLYKKLVLRSKAEFGYLSAYNNDLGVPPFERFFVGGSGLYGGSLDSREVIPLRGYVDQSLNWAFGRNVGGTVYNKFSFELRYPITLKPQASIYLLTFLEGANTYNNIKYFNPFSLKKSAGVGVRIFMSAFGLLGIDFGYGFDKVPDSYGVPKVSGWQTHFIMNQRL
jgi:outer membrane protein insertion porin family